MLPHVSPALVLGVPFPASVVLLHPVIARRAATIRRARTTGWNFDEASSFVRCSLALDRRLPWQMIFTRRLRWTLGIGAVLVMVPLTCAMFTDAATRLASDLEWPAKLLAWRAVGTRTRVAHQPRREPDGCEGAYEVTLNL